MRENPTNESLEGLQNLLFSGFWFAREGPPFVDVFGVLLQTFQDFFVHQPPNSNEKEI